MVIFDHPYNRRSRDTSGSTSAFTLWDGQPEEPNRLCERITDVVTGGLRTYPTEERTRWRPVRGVNRRRA